MNKENEVPAARRTIKGSHTIRRAKPKWQAYISSTLFCITLFLVFGFIVQEGLRWLT
ncbi:MAG: hypothetical protein V7735_18560 [Photobacterium frigidiphilum]|uniref:hypothetical protein n=1 Tax=Photobacterium frigidiphilum TaxID=264736 RepID=UPI0030015799